MKAIDKSGREIKIGDYIIYGHALGRCAGLRYGKVLKLNEKKDFNNKDFVDVTVIGIDDDWDFRGVKICDRKGTLLFPESRVLVIEEDQMPEEVLKLLKNYE